MHAHNQLRTREWTYCWVCDAKELMCPVIAEFLVKFLEQEVCWLNWDVGFVTSTMQEIGVQLPRLLEVYDQLFKTRVHAVPCDFLSWTFF